jgi:hypothetical protein
MTHEPQAETGLSRILGGFARFAGGIEARPATTIETQHVVGLGAATLTVPHINGALPGEIAGVDFWVPLVQLQLAPADDLLNSRYDPKEDPEFEQLKAALAALGDRIPSLPVIPANRAIVLPDGTAQPQYLVYDMPHVYYALIDLKRARARVHIPLVSHPGAILLSALGREGQMRREPSILEICRAARRLKEFYGYTVDEIAEQQAANREDKTRPSPQQVYNQINVAGLPEIVQDMLHRKQILWTHARDLAEAFLGDDRLCELCALLASQGRRMTVEEFGFVLRRLKGKLSRLDIDDGGVVHEFRTDQTLKLVGPPAEKSGGRTTDPVTAERPMVARPALIQREAGRFQVTLIPADRPEQIALTPDSFTALREWLAGCHTNTSVRETEALLLGFLHAIRQSARATGLLNAQGSIAVPIDALPEAHTGT